MNWDAIAAIAELLAAVGVIVSFVYLAQQIRQNTRVQRRSNIGDIATDLAATLRTASSDPELSHLVLRAFADLDSLDPGERYRFDCFFYPWVASPREGAAGHARRGVSRRVSAPNETGACGLPPNGRWTRVVGAAQELVHCLRQPVHRGDPERPAAG